MENEMKTLEKAKAKLSDALSAMRTDEAEKLRLQVAKCRAAIAELEGDRERDVTELAAELAKQREMLRLLNVRSSELQYAQEIHRIENERRPGIVFYPSERWGTRGLKQSHQPDHWRIRTQSKCAPW
jgi:hypothetical protein